MTSGPDRAASVRVADHLREAILAGEFLPGTWIRQEDVAERWGSSRVPAREALRMLQAEGLTEHVPQRGARVPRLDPHELDIVYRMRERLEPLALTESIRCGARADVATLREIQEAIEHNDDVERFLELDRAFHHTSYDRCEVETLMTTVRRLWNTTQHYRRAFVSSGGRQRTWAINAEHRLLIDAVEREDLVDAESYLTGHIRRTRIELGRTQVEVTAGGG